MTPPELAGREGILEQALVLICRVIAGRPEKSILMVGLRGVGKTVLLNEVERIAQEKGYRTVLVEAHETKPLGVLLIPRLRKLFLELNVLAGVGDKVRRGIGVLKSFAGAIKVTTGDVEFGLDIKPEQGSADSGDLEMDLPSLFVAVAEAAQERGTAVALLIDEIQYLKKNELSALIMAMHKMQQRRLPLVLIGAGLPTLLGLAGESKSYSERLFAFPNIGALSEHDAVKALAEPINEAGESIEPDALKEIIRLTRGYPYFLQEWGYQTWNLAESSPISLEVVKKSTELVTKSLDESFFRVRFDRLTPREKRFLRAMAQQGGGPYRISDVAGRLGVPLSNLGPIRASLIKKGMVYSPSHGDIDFTVPLFDEFMLRAMPEFN